MKEIKISDFNDVAKLKFGDDCTLYNKSYPKALAKYIEECIPPINIALQGEWGSGKTTLMNLVKEELRECDKVVVVNEYFNAWLFSQFDLGDQLPILLLTNLIKTVGDKKDFNLKDMFPILANIVAKKAGLSDNIMENFSLNVVEELNKLKNEFNNVVNDKLGIKKNEENDEKNKGKKLLIFIDDIDRIEPKKAVELLEAIKLFCETDHCVFVLAVDYEVILKGSEEKFGKNKGQEFFDKIIQVPFNMPIATFSLDKFLNKLVEKFIDEKSKEEEKKKLLKIYYDITYIAIGNNPRSIKRILNSFLIIHYIAKEQETYTDNYKIDNYISAMLYCLLCIENYNDIVYKYIIKSADSLNDGGIDSYISVISNILNDNEAKNEFMNSVSEEEFDFEILEIYSNVLKELKEKKVDVDRIKKVFNISSATVKNNKNVDDPKKPHYEKVKKCVIQEIERYINENKLLSINVTSKNTFTTKIINDMFVDNNFRNDSTKFEDLCGYITGTGGSHKNSWNKFKFNIGFKDLEVKSNVNKSLEKILRINGELKNDIYEEGNKKGLKVTLKTDSDRPKGNDSAQVFTVSYDEETDDEEILIQNIDNALDFILEYEKMIFDEINR